MSNTQRHQALYWAHRTAVKSLNQLAEAIHFDDAGTLVDAISAGRIYLRFLELAAPIPDNEIMYANARTAGWGR